MTVSAQAVTSQDLCGIEAVTVPQRGRIDVVTRSLLVQVCTFSKASGMSSIFILTF